MRPISFALALLLLSAGSSWAQEAAPTLLDIKVRVDTIWILLAGMLVFMMNLGFALLEAGLCRAKNVVNILSKNVLILAMTSISYWMIGWGLMYGHGNSFAGFSDFFLSPAAEPGKIPQYAIFFFQMGFAATSASIVSGAVAERVKYTSFLLFGLLMVAIIYPLCGHWVWAADGWLNKLGFLDFAGSTAVHSVGGWAALTGAIILGPRNGKFVGGVMKPMPGHNQALTALGAMILWFGWFGFNPGSQLAADPGPIASIIVATNIAGAAGVIAASAVTFFLLGKPDLSMAFNGGLAGLVAVTAGCNAVSPFGAVLIGIMAGVLVAAGVIFFDKIHVDDPIGAISVHLLNGVWGTLAVGFFHMEKGLFYGGGFHQIFVQLAGVVAVAIYGLAISVAAWKAINAVMGLRVLAEEEFDGLDLGEHGMEAYPEFMKTRGMM
ncbi:MAG: ammonium transporter [Nitrospinota bacterium]|nr:ammonium transporter [Nitrospinota bacterium]